MYLTDTDTDRNLLFEAEFKRENWFLVATFHTLYSPKVTDRNLLFEAEFKMAVMAPAIKAATLVIHDDVGGGHAASCSIGGINA